MKIALFGGSFDPPHLAHQQIIAFLIEQNEFDQIWVIPAHDHPFKKSSSAFEHRLNMCQLAFANLGEKIKILPDEKKLSGYTIDLVKYLVKMFPSYQFTFIGGADLEAESINWKQIAMLKEMIQFKFLPRALQGKLLFDAMSSTMIREKLKSQQSVDGLVSTQVIEYIKKNKLYQS